MDSAGFDALARSLAGSVNRRGFVGTALGLLAGALGARDTEAENGCPPGQSLNRKGDCFCPPGTDACPTGCFDLRRDTSNCGACGQGCYGGTCLKGTCRCPSGFTLCDDTCVDLANDPANCGSCGNACPSATPGTCQGAPICAAGACGHAPLPQATVCRSSASACDAPEVCDGISTECPEDRPYGAGWPCRPANGPCDVAEYCDGVSFSCPNDLRVAEGERGGCAEGLACYGGACAECGSTDDCSANEICRSNTCVACGGLRTACDPANNLCCQDQPTMCLENGLVGLQGRECCRPLGGACTQANDYSGDSDCCINSYEFTGGGYIGPCGYGGICGGQGGSCAVDTQCVSGSCRGHCNNQFPVRACTSHEECDCDGDLDDGCVEHVGFCIDKLCT